MRNLLSYELQSNVQWIYKILQSVKSRSESSQHCYRLLNSSNEINWRSDSSKETNKNFTNSFLFSRCISLSFSPRDSLSLSVNETTGVGDECVTFFWNSSTTLWSIECSYLKIIYWDWIHCEIEFIFQMEWIEGSQHTHTHIFKLIWEICNQFTWNGCRKKKTTTTMETNEKLCLLNWAHCQKGNSRGIWRIPNFHNRHL